MEDKSTYIEMVSVNIQDGLKKTEEQITLNTKKPRRSGFHFLPLLKKEEIKFRFLIATCSLNTNIPII